MKKIVTYFLVPFALVFAIFSTLISPMACSGTACKTTVLGCSVTDVLTDCTGVKTLDAAVAEATPIVLSLAENARAADGSINWSSIESKLLELISQYGMCVVSEIWNQHFVQASLATGSGSAAKLMPVLDPAGAKVEFERLRAKVAPHTSFKVKGGIL